MVWGCQRPFPFIYYGFLWEFAFLKFKTCSFYHEKLFKQKFNDMITQVLNGFYSAYDIMEAVRGHFLFYTMNARFRNWAHNKHTLKSRSVACLRSRLVAHLEIFRRLMKGKFDSYVLWPWSKKFQNWIVDRTEVRFTSFLSGGFITVIVVNQSERKLAKRTSVDRSTARDLKQISF